MQKKNKISISAALLCCLVSSGCAVDPKTGQLSLKETFASDDPCSNNARNIGIAVGAIAGVVIGNQVNHSNTARVLGAAAGATIGGLIGADVDRRRCALYKIAKANNLEMQVEDVLAKPTEGREGATSSSSGAGKPEVVGMKVAITDNGTQFLSGSDTLLPKAQAYFGVIADQYSYIQQKKSITGQSSKEDIAAVEQLKAKQIFLVGHTDDTGDSRFNAELSERRARAVARIFKDRGIPEAQIFYQGAGETLPVADNRTDAGRAKNRRVEIVDTPNQATFTQYLESRKPNLAFYRPNSDYAATTPTLAPVQHRARDNQAVADKKTAPSKAVVTPNVAKSRKTAPASKVATAPADAVLASDAAASKAAAATQVTTPAKASQQSAQVALPAMPATAVRSKGTATAGVETIDFGGAPVNGKFVVPSIGTAQTSPMLSFISSAHADDAMPLTSCAQDRPRVANGVKSLSNGRDAQFSTSDYMPGVYDSSWTGVVNGHLIALTHVAVLKDGGSPARSPNLLVYRNYTGSKTATPAYSGTPEVNTYRGSNALLYRVFAQGPTQCMDIVIPNSSPKSAPNSNLVYQQGGVLYQVAFTPGLVR